MCNFEDCFMQSEPNSIEFNLRIGCAIGACLVNVCVFFIFYFSKSRQQSSSIISNLIMFSCLIQAGLNYTIIGFSLINFDLSALGFFKSLYGYLLPNTPSTVEFYYSYFMMFFFIFQSLFLFFEAFYCWESIQLFKNPISSFSLRGKIYAFICLVLIIMIIAEIIVAYQTVLQYHAVYCAAMITLISYLLFILTALFSCFAIFNSLYNDTLMVSKEKKVFCYRHLAYCLLNFISLIYPFIATIRLMANIRLQTQNEKVRDYTIILYLYTVLGVFLDFFRLFELNLCSKTAATSNEAGTQENLDKSNENPLLPNSSFHLMENNKPIIDSAITTQIKTNFLEECFCYFIQCINHIASNQRLSVIPLKDNYYTQIANHLFSISKGEIVGITSSEPVHGSILKKFCNSLSIFSNKVQIIEYSPNIFHNIRKIDKISKEQLKDSFDLHKNLPNLAKFSGSEGKSGSIFFFTHDNKFILKTISGGELSALLSKDLIKPYYELLAENNHCLLAKIYGAYTLKIGLTNINVILMENIAPFPPEAFLYKFDLKGSEVGRETKQMLQNKSKTLKDMDFKAISKLHDSAKITLNGNDIAKIKECLKEDLTFLQNANLMDYSFFVAIMKNNIRIGKMNANRVFLSKNRDLVYLLGIIDYLTVYNNKKVLENTLLNVANFRKRNEFSAVNPILYRTRFYNFMYGNFLKE